MELLLKRIARKKDYTIGHLYVEGAKFCDTLEPTDRGLTQSMTPAEIQARKVKGITAIPAGRYRVRYTYSPRFKRYLPHVQDVPGFEGVRIHSGNSSKDTQGCPLLGMNKQVGRVLDSRKVCSVFYNLIADGEKRDCEVWLTVR